MPDTSNAWNITGGMDVVGADDEKVGNVVGLQGDFIVASKGFFFPTDYYIPLSAVTAVTNNVHLNVSKDEALNQGWDTIPEAGATAETEDDTAVADAGLHVDNPTDEQYVMPEPDMDTDAVDGVGARDPNTPITVPLREEALRARTQEVERGRARVERAVTEDEQAVDVPVTEEHVTVHRQTIDREVAPGETVFTEGTIEVPLHGEEVVIDKDVHVVEEIEIGTERVERIEHVTETVRREEARVYDEEGNLVDVADEDITR